MEARYIWDVEVAGSNPVAPTNRNLTSSQNFDIIFIQEKAEISKLSCNISRWWSNGSSSGSCPEDVVRFQRAQPIVATIQIRSGLIHGFTLSTTTHSNAQHPVSGTSSGYEVCGYAAKDHLKINEGEGKEKYGPVV